MEVGAMRALVRPFLEKWLTRYQQDLEAIPEARFAVSPGGEARSAADFTAECVKMNRYIAALMRRETPGPLSRDGWVRAEGAACEKQAGAEAFRASAQELLAAFDAFSDEELVTPIQGLFGPTPPYEIAHFIATHIAYHDAQLNYLQALGGDTAMHWR